MAELFQHYETGEDGSSGWMFSTFWNAQIFTPSASHTIKEVQLYLARYQYNDNDPGLITVSIKATDGGGQPTGEDLCSGTANGSDLLKEPTFSWVSFDMGAGTPLTSGIKYAIVIRATFDGGFNILYWRWDNGGGYSGGNYDASLDSGGSWVGGYSTDMYFREYGTELEADPPNKATNPSPADSDTEVDFSGLKLSWEDGGGADTFNVYIGKTGDLTLVSSAQAGTDYTTTIAELETIFDASPIDQKIYWRVDATNNTGTTEGDKWNFDARPAKATTPFPTDAMTTMTLDWSNFSWDEATTALTYDVYAGTETGEEVWDSNMTLIVKDGELHTLSQAYMLAAMNMVYPNTGMAAYNYTYYWKVNTKNAFGVTEGDFWSFTTIPFDHPAVSYILLGGGSGPYDIPPGVEGIDFRYNGENNMITVKRLVAAANNKIWIEDL